MPATTPRWSCPPYSVVAADRIARELTLLPTTAAVLVRRGYETVEEARRFLSADERHDPWRLGDMERACDLILGHVRRGSRIVVFGDYDVDGVSSTAIIIEALRAVGASASWRLPSRLEGYGLSAAAVDRLAAEGTGLLITADCGITAAAEIEAARARGIDVVVTDHHRPAERLPDCPLVHPGVGGYPFEGLCAAGVAHKLSAAVRERAGRDPAEAAAELDLVALATVCDMVPLRGENRRLVREGMRAIARTTRPGLRALMRVAALDGANVDERALGFRLGPRLNAAGRLRRADAALELLLTADESRAAEVADELELLNRDRRDAETRALFALEAERAAQEAAPAYVIAGEGWHPGVVGIVASRIAERHHRPCVVITLGPDGGRGSGRSIPPFDLHAGLAACRANLRRFGGHRAAAGLEIDPDRVDAFRRDFVAHAAATLTPWDLVPVAEVDAVVPGTALGLPLAEELSLLAPFGQGNPEPTLLVPSVQVAAARAMGQDAQHARFTLVSSGSSAQAVAFRTSAGSLSGGDEEPVHAAVRVELNEWNRRVEARVVLSTLLPAEAGRCAPCAEPEPFWEVVDRELGAAGRPVVRDGDGSGVRAVIDRRGEGIAGAVGELLASGEAVLVACADVSRRRAGLERLVAGLSPLDDTGRERTELRLAAWSELADRPSLASPFPHLVALDPPAGEQPLDAAKRAPGPDEASFLHLVWGPHEVEFALAAARAELDLRTALADVYRALRRAGTAEGDALEALLRGDGAHPRTPVQCARLLTVLGELGLVALERTDDGRRSCRAVASRRTSLDRSPTYRYGLRRLEECERYLAAEAARWPERRMASPAAAAAGRR